MYREVYHSRAHKYTTVLITTSTHCLYMIILQLRYVHIMFISRAKASNKFYSHGLERCVHFIPITFFFCVHSNAWILRKCICLEIPIWWCIFRQCAEAASCGCYFGIEVMLLVLLLLSMRHGNMRAPKYLLYVNKCMSLCVLSFFFVSCWSSIS